MTVRPRVGQPRTVPTRRGETRQQRGDDTRAAIIAETVACILEEGFSAASARHITERANVTWGVIQYHFGDRDQLLMAVVDEGFAGLRRSIAEMVLPAGPLRERIAVVVETAWTAFSHPTSMAALEILVATRVSRNKKLNRHLIQVNNELTALGKTLLVPDRHGDEIADLLWACLRGLTIPHMVTPRKYDFSKQRQALINLFTLYLSDEE